MLAGIPKKGVGRAGVPKREGVGVSSCIIEPKLKPPGVGDYS
jgi:hypothetical protein